MNPTVAVALITALSTLTGAGLTGLVSAWLNGRQLTQYVAAARQALGEPAPAVASDEPDGR